MHIPGKPLIRPNQSNFRFTDRTRMELAGRVRLDAANLQPMQRIHADNFALRIEAQVGRTQSRNTDNQRKRRLAHRARHAAGDRFAFTA